MDTDLYIYVRFQALTAAVMKMTTLWDIAPIFGLVDCLFWGETDVSELRPVRAYYSSPSDCGVNHGMMVSSTRALRQPPVLSGGPVSSDISGASRRMGEGNENLLYLSPWDFYNL
jgi:hypothetical protein